MFQDEPDRARETPAEQARRRAMHGLDRRGLHHVLLAMVIIFGGIASVVAADVVGVERRRTMATVVVMVDRLAMKRSPQCITQLTTGFGDAEIYTHNFCRNAPWRIGDQAEVEARQLRFSRLVIVSTRGTRFEGAHSFLPES